MLNWKHIVIIFTLSACATEYKADGFGGGFSETRLDDNVFSVTFKGNGYTSKERASDFLLLRSAELALANGYKYFVVTDRGSYEKRIANIAPVTSSTTTNATTTGSIFGSGSFAFGSASTTANSTTTTSGGLITRIVKPRETNMIVCFKEKPQNVLSFNARFIYDQITAKYEIISNY